MSTPKYTQQQVDEIVIHTKEEAVAGERKRILALLAQRIKDNDRDYTERNYPNIGLRVAVVLLTPPPSQE